MTAVVTLVVILLLINWKILGKEDHLTNGHVVYLELAPVDPRSLMQGDYMALRFKIAANIRNFNKDTEDGFVQVGLNDQGVGEFLQLREGTPPSVFASSQNQTLWLQYRRRAGRIKFATNAFFFQEGHADYYADARYGQFRVDDHGELLLTGMFDDGLARLGPPNN